MTRKKFTKWAISGGHVPLRPPNQNVGGRVPRPPIIAARGVCACYHLAEISEHGVRPVGAYSWQQASHRHHCVVVLPSLGGVVSGVHRMNEVNARRARLLPGWVTVFGRVGLYHLGM